MDASDQAAEQVVRMTLSGSEMVVRLAGTGAKNVGAALMAAAASKEKTKGKTRLAAMLKSGKELKVFPIPTARLKDFAAEAKRYGVLYVVVKQAGKEAVDLLVRAEDASKVNRIVDKLNLACVKAAEGRKESAAPAGERPEPTQKDTKVRLATAEDLLAELGAAPKAGKQLDNPLASSPKSDPQSGPTSKRGARLEKAGEPKKPSVRAHIRQIEDGRAAKPPTQAPTKAAPIKTSKER